jgi:hypothetical protein
VDNKNILVYWWNLKLFSFVDEHDRDVILDTVSQATRMTNQFVVLPVVLQIPLALGACQNVQKFFIQHHTLQLNLQTSNNHDFFFKFY